VDELFWDHCAQDELWLQRCAVCGHRPWPPTEACEACGGGQFHWERLSGRGTVVSWCTFEKPYYEQLPVPWDVILVQLEEGPLFITNPLGFDVSEVAFDMPVTVAFVAAEDDAGPFRLPVFQKA
jgi:uncharacterized OB-fold protein